MEWVKRKIRFWKRRNDRLSPWYIENGGKLLEGLIASSNGKYNIPYRVFTVEELNKATDIDFTCIGNDISRSAMVDETGYYISGIFQQRSILVKKFYVYAPEVKGAPYAVKDIVITVQMNHHKNVLKILGCCLDIEIPAIIYEIEKNYGLLYDLLFKRKEGNFENNIGRSLSWSNRLKIATDVANAVVYLHTAFPTPIIHSDLNTKNIVIDHHGVAKLVDFSLCIALPPGESQLEVDFIFVSNGHVDPECITTGIITEKGDVYAFGMILLELLTCRRPDFGDHKFIPLQEYVKNHIDENELSKVLDPRIVGESGEIEQEHQLQAFSKLALRCTRDKGADRPEIIDVAKELVRIQRSIHPV
ncbi:non-functional pseudokinase ZED1-like [Olea europaea var. sylvestris]|uniref:non-functional pseudokinase ZED1-like n=1 Tax=Olea europaea var. sylvestris TaxID=158386 RepID=UPI000C1D2DEC|nr:non-functional pseudokinase ZED1-like [Olea europaea var. sylvestris]